MTSKAKCIKICKRGRSKIFNQYVKDLKEHFGYDENTINAIALQMHFRRTNLEPSAHNITFIRELPIRLNAWTDILTGLRDSTIENNKRLWDESP
jgi:hypothetical protein